MLGALVRCIAAMERRGKRARAQAEIIWPPKVRLSSPASPPRRPASCTSAAPARPCSTGCSPAIMAASSCCASRTPTRRARPRRRSTRSSTACAGSASIGTATNITSRNSGPRHAEVAHELLERGARLSLLHDAGGTGRAAREGAGRTAAVPHRQPVARRAPTTQGDTPFVIRLKAPREGETVIDDLVQGRVTVQMPSSTISSCSAPTARRPTCWRWWSTIMTWASPTSSAATTTSTTPSASWRSSARWAGRSRSMPMSR